ncbi:MAG: GNAT family N-acetyltransferase, partial [Candidatus Aminicenantes bacterium]|nr:GNAT family N-acetyltransferase [Candidatus Aminicenantes bacterium]
EITLSGSQMIGILSAIQDKKGIFRFQVKGTSMVPSICEGDMITLSLFRPFSPTPGEVVAFRHPLTERLILHRVIGLGQNAYYVNGDNIHGSDLKVPEKNLLGAVVRVDREGRQLYWPDRSCFPFRAKLYFSLHLKKIQIKKKFRSLLRDCFLLIPRFSLYRKTARHLLDRSKRKIFFKVIILQSTARYSTEKTSLARQEITVLEFTARWSDKTMGSVHLLKYPHGHFPYTGYWLSDLHIRLRYRGMGLGEQLTRKVISHADENGAKELWLLVRENNRPALTLYKKMGFVKVDLPVFREILRKEKNTLGYKRILMQLKIKKLSNTRESLST